MGVILVHFKRTASGHRTQDENLRLFAQYWREALDAHINDYSILLCQFDYTEMSHGFGDFYYHFDLTDYFMGATIHTSRVFHLEKFVAKPRTRSFLL